MLQLNLEFYTRCMSEVRAEGETKVSEHSSFPNEKIFVRYQVKNPDISG